MLCAEQVARCTVEDDGASFVAAFAPGIWFFIDDVICPLDHIRIMLYDIDNL